MSVMTVMTTENDVTTRQYDCTHGTRDFLFLSRVRANQHENPKSARRPCAARSHSMRPLTNLNSPPDETRWHLKEVPRWGGGVHDKNVAYSVGNHASMATDTVRCSAYAEAIGRVARGRRCLDVGTGPFLLLARLCERAGASFVAAVEDSPAAVRLAIELRATG